MAVCGLWQCGTKQFQMTLTRSFTNPGMTLPTGCATRLDAQTPAPPASVSSLRLHPSPLTPHPSPLTPHPSPLAMDPNRALTPKPDANLNPHQGGDGPATLTTLESLAVGVASALIGGLCTH